MARLLTRMGVSVTCTENGTIALNLILGTDSVSKIRGFSGVPTLLSVWTLTFVVVPLLHLRTQHHLSDAWFQGQLCGAVAGASFRHYLS